MTERTLGYAAAQLDRGSAAGDDGPMTFTASTTRLNRHGWSMRTDGWRLDNYAGNPVILWMHNPFQPPIGRGLAANKGDRISVDVTFDRDDEVGRLVESKYRRGFLSAVSVGLEFQDEAGAALNMWSLKPDQIRDEAFYDLVEISAVTTPADPGALVENHRAALSYLGAELVRLFDDQDHAKTAPASTITAEQLAAAVRAELDRLGISLDAGKQSDKDGSRTAAVDQDAARAVLAAFSLKE